MKIKISKITGDATKMCLARVAECGLLSEVLLLSSVLQVPQVGELTEERGRELGRGEASDGMDGRYFPAVLVPFVILLSQKCWSVIGNTNLNLKGIWSWSWVLNQQETVYVSMMVVEMRKAQ